jgi:hypothetical protein
MQINRAEMWMISNRQPWVYALTHGLIRSKTRSDAVWLPPEGATVFLHASKAMWQPWRWLWWACNLKPRELQRGGICAVATLERVGPTDEIMPEQDKRYFRIPAGVEPGYYSVANSQTMLFANIHNIDFIPCRGAQVPTRKLPREVTEWLNQRG